MKKIDSRPQGLGKVLHDAVRSGKQVGAPALNKALKQLSPEKLGKREIKQLRDAFEHGRLTPKARSLVEKLLGHGSSVNGPGVHKFRADEPVRPSQPGVVKVKADQPVGSQPPPPISIKPPLVKVKADLPVSPQPQPPISTRPPLVKVKADQPISPLPQPINPRIVKVKADEPL